MEYKHYEYKKKKHTADLYEQFIDRKRVDEMWENHKLTAKQPPTWTLEDQALEDILWAS